VSERQVTGRTTAWVFAGLMLLAATTFGLSFLRLGAWSPALAFGIAGAKAVLIAAFFMHLVEQRAISRWFFALGIVLASLLLIMMGADVLTRERPQFRQPGMNMMNPSVPTREGTSRPSR
jgi:cytochrome c oxidase subunit 4